MTIKLEAGNLNRFSKITEIANLNPVYCKETDNLNAVVDKAISLNHRRLPVISKDMKLVGIVTYMDILDALLRGQKTDMMVSNIMTRDVIYSNADDTIGYILQKLKMSRRGGIPIIKDKKLIGVVSERDFVKRFSDVNFGIQIKDVMTPKPFFISKKFSILNSLKSLVNTRYRRLPVVENNILIGIVTAYDVLKYLHDHDYNLAALEEPIDFIMKTDVYTISAERDVSEAVKMMKVKDVGGILVTNKNNLEGIVTERDVLEQIT